jgi:peptidoglycan-N-acetylglucosamine deacetylase
VPFVPTPAPTAPPAAPGAPPQPPPVQVVVAPPGPVVPRAEILTALPDRSTIALTFDDGPGPRWTPEVLAVLRRHGAVATFCMVSENLPGREALVQEVAAAGMRLCDHSRTHDEQLPDQPPERIADEVLGAGAALSAAAGGAPVDWFRAPGGNWSSGVVELAARHGMQPLGWTVDPRDWAQPGVAAIVAAVQREIQGGSIVLLHDGGGPREQTVQALEELIPWLAARGYRFGFPVA